MTENTKSMHKRMSVLFGLTFWRVS